MTRPGCLTAMPSARVTTGPAGAGSPAYGRADGGLDADDAHVGTLATSPRSPRRTASPPPPSGTTTQARSARSSTSSRPSVPCPATTAGSSNGWQNAMPLARRPRPGGGHRLVERGADLDHLGAVARQASILVIGAPAGTKMSHGTPKWRAANARAWAWLPALPAVTPLAAAGAERRQLVHRPADLEGARALKVLGLEHDRRGRSDSARRRTGCAWRRPTSRPAPPDVVERHRRAADVHARVPRGPGRYRGRRARARRRQRRRLRLGLRRAPAAPARLRLHRVHREHPTDWPALDGVELVLTLGSEWNVYRPETAERWRPRQRSCATSWPQRAPAGHLLRRPGALPRPGGTVSRTPTPEIGWFDLDVDAGAAGPDPGWSGTTTCSPCPEGSPSWPAPPPAPSSIRGRRCVATQFHPEATETMVTRWLGMGGADSSRHGGDPDELLAATRANVASAAGPRGRPRRLVPRRPCGKRAVAVVGRRLHEPW